MKKDSGAKKTGRLEKVIIPLLIVLVSLLSYSVGVLNGKKMSDREYTMKSGEGHEATAAHGEENDGDEVADNEDDLSDEDVNHLASAAIEGAEKNSGKLALESATEPGTAEHGSAPIVKHAAVAAPALAKNAHGENHSVAAVAPEAKHEVKKDAAALPAVAKAVKADEGRTPSSVTPAATNQYTVQVASYPDFKDAEKMAVALYGKGYPAFSFKVDIKGQTWYRVSIGGYKTKKEAVALQTELVKQGVVKDSVVQKIR